MSHFVLAARLCDARLFRDPTYFRESIHGSLYMFLLVEFWRSVYSNGLVASSIYSLNFFWRRYWGRHGETISLWSAAEYFVVISCCVFVVANLEMKVTLVIPTGQQGPHVSMFCHCCMDLNDETRQKFRGTWGWEGIRGHSNTASTPRGRINWLPYLSSAHHFQLLSFRHAKTL